MCAARTREQSKPGARAAKKDPRRAGANACACVCFLCVYVYAYLYRQANIYVSFYRYLLHFSTAGECMLGECVFLPPSMHAGKVRKYGGMCACKTGFLPSA